ncbi:MAG: hypothetical protein QXT19_00840 [Candidatus Woesearchaeota archaeon]
MKKILFIAALIALLYPVAFVAAQPGCCCDPIVFNGSLVFDRADCDETYWKFTSELPVLGEKCDDVCEAVFAPPIFIPQPVSCNSPDYKPAPQNLAVLPVKGKKHLRITYSLPCPAETYYVNISRCKGDDCDDFTHIAQATPSGFYTDISPDLEWNSDYTYKLVSASRVSGASEPAIASGRLNDIECWHKGYEQFCIGDYYYDLFEQYLKTYGYAGITPAAFDADFSSAVIAAFHEKFNRGWACDEANTLYQKAPAVNCKAGEQCVLDEDGIMCISQTACDRGGMFGIYSTLESCEGNGEKYCFYDRSHSSIDECYACNPRMACADYRTKGACERDNCHAGVCEWHDVIPSIGIGVCVDKRFANCAWCKAKGTPGFENNDAYNDVFDQCTAEKSKALAVPEFLCIYDKNAQESNSCDAAACMDYNETQCGSPAGGIKLNPDNSIAVPSTDPCNIKVCQNIAGAGCVKNHDANSIPDCALKVAAPERRQCELDYFPPNTTLVPTTFRPNRIDWLAVKMLDRLNATDDGTFMEGKPGYRLRVCVVGRENPCASPSDFASTNYSMLNFNDVYLQGGREVLATMRVGENTLRYYGVDRANNPEIIKEMAVVACDKCQGPKVLEVTVSPGKLVNGKYYTTADTPIITVSFNEPATLTSAALLLGNKVMPVTASPSSGANYEYTFIPLRPLLDGEYTFTFNAKDNNGIFMDDTGSVSVIVDTTPGDITIIPEDGAVIGVGSVDITIRFNEPLTLLAATLENEVWASKYAAKKVTTNLMPLLAASDDGMTYSATVAGLSGGKKNIKVRAEDLAGNPAIGRSSFWVDLGPMMMRLKEPSWGVSASYVFDIVVETSRTAVCKYSYDLPAPPSETAFEEFLWSFPEETAVTHKIPDFDRIAIGDLKTHKLYVYCKAGSDITMESFELRVDPTPPVIKSAYAYPDVIIERRLPGQDIFTTSLKVQTDDDGFCKYSTENVPFVLMDGVFPGFDEIPKKSHNAEINVTQDATEYTYYVACKNIAEMPSATVPVRFSVDLSVPFAATSNTPPYSNTTEFVLRVETNKRSFCYVSETIDAEPVLMGGFGYAHTAPANVTGPGKYKWFVKCSTGAGNEIATLEIPVVVDTTPPEMLFVDDSSNLPNEPEFSYFPDQLRLNFLGEDNETNISAYYYRLLTYHANTTVLNWTLSTNLNATPFYVTGLSLVDGNKYRFEVYPVNIVGLHGNAMASNGVTIDFEKAPAICENGVKDANETDIDCGGQCPGCIDGAACSANTDCQSGYCNNGICALAACDDGVKNANETDIDCGGGVCLPCGMNKTCIQNSDCASGSCNFGLCTNPDPCADGILSGTESDVDCGGSCPTKCGDGKNCLSTLDCSVGLMCIESTCQPERDSDKDLVPDDRDKCPNTPQDEVTDENGCSPSQRFSCGDEISDGWRIRHFGSVLCIDNGAPHADPDKDLLTNLEEYRYGTSPTNSDTDYDTWNDKIEIEKGTNPLDASSHPPSKLRMLLWVLLVLLIIGAIGIGGYIGYKYYLEIRTHAAPPPLPTKPLPKAPVKKIKPVPPVIDKLRRIARKEEPGVTDREWVSMAELAERLKKEKVPMPEDVFDRLKDLLSGRIPRREAPSVLAAIQKEPEAFRLLRRISFERLTPAEKALVKKRLAFLKAGKITPAELEEILAKLRITAAYYKTHKKELERELAEWLNERRKKK